jgi:hypothetical protein
VEDLPKGEFRVCRVTVVNGAAKINLAEARRVAGPVQKAPHYCGAWVTVSVAGIAKAERSYPDIDPAADFAGVSLLDRKVGPYRALLKMGDYDGRLLLVRDDGTLADIPGPAFFLAGPRYVVTVQRSDGPAVTVFDLRSGRVVFQEDVAEASRRFAITAADPDPFRWVQIGSDFFWVPGEPTSTAPVQAVRLDLAAAQLKADALTSERVARGVPVEWIGTPGWTDCSCGVSGTSTTSPFPRIAK